MIYGKTYQDSAPLFFDEGRAQTNTDDIESPGLKDCTHTKQRFTIASGWVCKVCGAKLDE